MKPDPYRWELKEKKTMDHVIGAAALIAVFILIGGGVSLIIAIFS